MAKVFGVSATISEVVDYLKDPPAGKVNSIPPLEVYHMTAAALHCPVASNLKSTVWTQF